MKHPGGGGQTRNAAGLTLLDLGEPRGTKQGQSVERRPPGLRKGGGKPLSKKGRLNEPGAEKN